MLFIQVGDFNYIFHEKEAIKTILNAVTMVNAVL
jgi:hypothetical protein